MYSHNDFHDYAQTLLCSTSLDQAFKVFERQVLKLDFDGVLYTFIPKLLLDAGLPQTPAYKSSTSYNPSFLSRYFESRFNRHNPILKAICEGNFSRLDWWIETDNNTLYEQQSRKKLRTKKTIEYSMALRLRPCRITPV